MTHVSTFIFQGLFKNMFFRYLALVTKWLLAILDFFFTDRTLINSLNYYSLKVTKFHGQK